MPHKVRRTTCWRTLLLVFTAMCASVLNLRTTMVNTSRAATDMWRLSAHREGVQVITANPKTAGVARWNFLALWGHKMGRGDRAAQDYCRQARTQSGTFYAPNSACLMSAAGSPELPAKCSLGMKSSTLSAERLHTM